MLTKEVDKNKDCVWVLIYNELKEQNKLDEMKKMHKPKDYSKTIKPQAKSLI